MRVSTLIVVALSCITVALAAETAAVPTFDQASWNRAVENLLGAIIMGPFADHFTPGNITQQGNRDDRLRMQVNRLRARVGIRLAESLNDYEIICPFDHIGREAFALVEQELRAKGWYAHWVTGERVRVCGGAKGFLFVSLKK